MTIEKKINNYIISLIEPKQTQIYQLHEMILNLLPNCKLWYLDGKNEENKVVANPNIGYGTQQIKYSNGKTKDFYKIGLSANSTGISIYIIGIKDKKYLINTYGNTIGKATVTGYCIKFKSIKDINLNILSDAVKFGFEYTV
jgi:hypothetical protein